MRKAIILLCLCLLLCGCRITAAPAAVQETEAPTALLSPTVAPTPAPTPVMIAGSAIQDSTLCAVLTAEDFAELDAIPDLVTLDVSGSTCYDAILAYCDAHPNVDVRYTVTFGDEAIPCDAETATLKTLSDPALLRYLPHLSVLTIEEPLSIETAQALLTALPNAALQYAVSAAGLSVASDETALDLSDVSPAQAEPIAAALSVLPQIETVTLDHADGTTDWTLETAGILQAVRPDLRVAMHAEAFGVSFSLTDEIVTFSGIDLSARVDELYALLPYLRSVRRLDMENCRIPNEEMAALREAFPTPKVVWRVRVGAYECRTDAIMIRFSDSKHLPMLTDRDTQPLQYCNEVKYLDLGHNDIQHPDFVAYMPNLEVCILAIYQPTDLSAFANCTHLEYAELFNGYITDVSPLANCKELKHLNLARNKISDITPLYGLTNLERLWISMNPIPAEQAETIRALLPDCVVDTEAWEPTHNEWRYDETRESGLSERYELLCRQFDYQHFSTHYYIEEPDTP